MRYTIHKPGNSYHGRILVPAFEYDECVEGWVLFKERREYARGMRIYLRNELEELPDDAG